MKYTNFQLQHMTVSVCESCGAMIGDRPIHDKWHESYGKVAQQAYHADMMFRPIGGR